MEICDYCGEKLEADFKEVEVEESDPFLPSMIIRIHPEHDNTFRGHRTLPDGRRILKEMK